MNFTELKNELQASLIADDVIIGGDDYHIQLTIIAAQFSGLAKIKRQQAVYAVLNPYIQQGDLHAVTMKTYTPEEWIHVSK